MASSKELAKQIEETILSQLRNGDITRDQALDRASDLDYEGANQTESSVRSSIYSTSIASDPDYTVDKARSDVTSDSKIIDADVPAARASIYQAAVQSAKVALDEAMTLIRNDQHLSQEISDATERNVIKADFVGGSKDLSVTVNRISNSDAFSDKKKAVREVLDYARDNELISGDDFNEYTRDIDNFIVSVINDDLRVNTSARSESVPTPNVSAGRVLGESTSNSNNANNNQETNNQETVVKINHYNTQGGNMNLTQILAGIADDNASLINALTELKSSNEIADKEAGYKQIINRARELDFINNDLWRIFTQNASGFVSKDYDPANLVRTIRTIYYRDEDPLRAEGGSNNIAASQGVGVGALDEVSVLDTPEGAATGASSNGSGSGTLTTNSPDAQAILTGIADGTFNRNQAPVLINGLTDVTPAERADLHNTAQAMFEQGIAPGGNSGSGSSGTGSTGAGANNTGGTQAQATANLDPITGNSSLEDILRHYDAGNIDANGLIEAVSNSSATGDDALTTALEYAAANRPGQNEGITPYNGTVEAGSARPDNLSAQNTQQVVDGGSLDNVQLNIHDSGTPTQYIGRDFSDGRADIVGGVTAQPTGLPYLEDLRPDLYPYGLINYAAQAPANPGSKGPDGIWGGPGAVANFGLTPQDSLMMLWNTPISSGSGIQIDPATGKYIRFGNVEAQKRMIANQFSNGNAALAQQIYNDLVDPGSIGPRGLAHGAVGGGWFAAQNQDIHGINDAGQGSYQGSPLIQQGSGIGAAGLAVYPMSGRPLPARLTAQDKNIEALVNQSVGMGINPAGGMTGAGGQMMPGGPGGTVGGNASGAPTMTDLNASLSAQNQPNVGGSVATGTQTTGQTATSQNANAVNAKVPTTPGFDSQGRPLAQLGAGGYPVVQGSVSDQVFRHGTNSNSALHQIGRNTVIGQPKQGGYIEGAPKIAYDLDAPVYNYNFGWSGGQYNGANNPGVLDQTHAPGQFGAISYGTARKDGKTPTASDPAITERAVMHNFVYEDQLPQKLSDVGTWGLRDLIKLRAKSIQTQQQTDPRLGGVSSSVQNTPALFRLEQLIQQWGPERVYEAIASDRFANEGDNFDYWAALTMPGIGPYGAINPDGSAKLGTARVTSSEDPSLIDWQPGFPNATELASGEFDVNASDVLANSGLAQAIDSPGAPQADNMSAEVGGVTDVAGKVGDPNAASKRAVNGQSSGQPDTTGTTQVGNRLGYLSPDAMARDSSSSLGVGDRLNPNTTIVRDSSSGLTLGNRGSMSTAQSDALAQAEADKRARKAALTAASQAAAQQQSRAVAYQAEQDRLERLARQAATAQTQAKAAREREEELLAAAAKAKKKTVAKKSVGTTTTAPVTRPVVATTTTTGGGGDSFDFDNFMAVANANKATADAKANLAYGNRTSAPAPAGESTAVSGGYNSSSRGVTTTQGTNIMGGGDNRLHNIANGYTATPAKTTVSSSTDFSGGLNVNQRGGFQ